MRARQNKRYKIGDFVVGDSDDGDGQSSSSEESKFEGEHEQIPNTRKRRYVAHDNQCDSKELDAVIGEETESSSDYGGSDFEDSASGSQISETEDLEAEKAPEAVNMGNEEMEAPATTTEYDQINKESCLDAPLTTPAERCEQVYIKETNGTAIETVDLTKAISIPISSSKQKILDRIAKSVKPLRTIRSDSRPKGKIDGENDQDTTTGKKARQRSDRVR